MSRSWDFSGIPFTLIKMGPMCDQMRSIIIILSPETHRLFYFDWLFPFVSIWIIRIGLYVLIGPGNGLQTVLSPTKDQFLLFTYALQCTCAVYLYMICLYMLHNMSTYTTLHCCPKMVISLPVYLNHALFFLLCLCLSLILFFVHFFFLYFFLSLFK